MSGLKRRHLSEQKHSKDQKTYGEYIALARKTNQSRAKCFGAGFEES
jgi:hypothetical protein